MFGVCLEPTCQSLEIEHGASVKSDDNSPPSSSQNLLAKRDICLTRLKVQDLEHAYQSSAISEKGEATDLRVMVTINNG